MNIHLSRIFVPWRYVLVKYSDKNTLATFIGGKLINMLVADFCFLHY